MSFRTRAATVCGRANAIAMAMIQRKDYGRRTLLLEMDFDNPTLAGQLGVERWPGLAELVRGEATLPDVVHPFADGIAAVTMGAGPGAAPRTVIELLRSGVLQDLGQEFVRPLAVTIACPSQEHPSVLEVGSRQERFGLKALVHGGSGFEGRRGIIELSQGSEHLAQVVRHRAPP